MPIFFQKPENISKTMKAIFEFLVVILFFATYELTKNIILATEIAIAAGIIQACWCLYKYHRLQTMQWISLLLVIIFGGATILLNNPYFIMWKPSVLFWVMAIGLFLSQVLNKNILKITLDKEIMLPATVWRKLTYVGIIYLLLLGGLNLVVAYNFTEEQWVKYKLFGSPVLLFLFFIGLSLYINAYRQKD